MYNFSGGKPYWSAVPLCSSKVLLERVSKGSTLCKQWQEVKTFISGIKISPEGEEMVADIYGFTTGMYNSSDYMYMYVLLSFITLKVGRFLKSDHIVL